MKIVLIDNYDSFTYNLVHLVNKIDSNIQLDVIRNNQFKLEELKMYDKILLSPGPGLPSESGLLLETIKYYAESKSILGICLGHQAIGEVFGGKLINLENVYHGIATNIQILKNNSENSALEIFNGLPDSFEVGRYHSWVVDNNQFPKELIITSVDDNNIIMSMKHRTLDVQGLQFHPESILTPVGFQIMQNWLINR